MMKMLIGLVMVAMIKYIAAEITSYSLSDCVSTQANSSKKWCRYSTSTSYGYICNTSETSSICTGKYSYRCSSDSYYLPNNSKKLLCPYNSTICGTQTFYMYSAGTKSKMYSNYISTSNVCWFKFSAQSSSIKTIGIEINLLENATAEVYYEYSTNKFEYKGTATLSNSVNVSVSYSYSVWVLATPTQNNGVIIAYANAYTDSSSSFSIDVNKTLVIVCSIILCFFIIAVPTALISMKCINNCKKVLNERDRQRNQERAAVLNNLPQINEGELSDHL